ncbi:MAG: MarR family transcriptional regulator [Sedimentisphaerales bacterium]|nr:MarR family transcriptional regulator [Sedimentisphaerales bacterium]
MNAQKHGITANQFVLLMFLAEDDGISQRDLVERAFSDPNTIRAMLVLLEKRGLVERDQHPEDGRKRNVTITLKGREIYQKVSDENETMRQTLTSLFSPEEIQKLILFLDTISKAMTESVRKDKIKKAQQKLLHNKI